MITDGTFFLSANVDGENDGSRRTREILYCKEYVEGGVVSTKGETERLALVDDGEEDEWVARTNKTEMRNW